MSVERRTKKSLKMDFRGVGGGGGGGYTINVFFCVCSQITTLVKDSMYTWEEGLERKLPVGQSCQCEF